uniref:NADHcytochrome b5 reductase 1 n=1 Tax=Rhizophora mucronata TaxID=61149 RepID=A0A2P2KD37_RHIMU
MLAGGSGITPMFQVARAILENPKDRTKVYLIYANVKYEDIILKRELDDLAFKYSDLFKIYYVLNQPPEAWNGGVGSVSKEMIEAHCPAPAPDIQILRCGLPPMNKAVAAHLEAPRSSRPCDRDAVPVLIIDKFLTQRVGCGQVFNHLHGSKLLNASGVSSLHRNLEALHVNLFFHSTPRNFPYTGFNL